MTIELLKVALTEVGNATAVIGNKHGNTSKRLFESDQEADVRFNGCKSIQEYRNLLKNSYNQVKNHFSLHYPIRNSCFTYQDEYELFSHCLFEVAETRRDLFNSDKDPHLARIEINKQYNIEPRLEPMIKKKFLHSWQNSGII